MVVEKVEVAREMYLSIMLDRYVTVLYLQICLACSLKMTIL